MTWDDAIPNLLIGLREGLEAGLIVSILLAALRKIEPAEGAQRPSSAPIWLGVLGAVMVSGSFAAVLTFSTDVLSSAGQEAVGGLLSVLAVGLVTAMIFWMRRTAALLSRELRGKVAEAIGIGSGALAITAFLAVGREGLETTLFLWTAVRASGQTVAPLVGAGIGLALAVALCALLYRQAIRLNLGVFFSRTAFALIVIAAGVLSYGLGDLQDAGLIPGQSWVAFDLSSHLDSGSWWVTLITGVTDLSTRMTVLQVAAWVLYLAVVVPAFVLAGRRPMVVPTASTEPAATTEQPGTPTRLERLGRRRPATVAAALVVVPVVAAGLTIAVLPAAAAGSSTTVTVTDSSCAPTWTSAHAGTQSFQVRNESGRAGEVNLDNAAGAVVAEIETLGPATTGTLEATLGNGTYTFRCLMAGQAVLTSATVQVSGARGVAGPAAVLPVTLAELTGPNHQYETYVAGVLRSLAAQVTVIDADLARDDLAAARRDWLPAQLDWERVGASYDSFGDLGVAVDGLPSAYVGGVDDPNFTGLHRLEYGLWSGQSAAQLRPVVATLAKDVAAVQANLTSDDLAGDPTNLPIRAHEIIEDAIRDHLSAMDDVGAHAEYAQTAADIEVDRVVLDELAPLIVARAPGLLAQVRSQLTTMSNALEQAKVNGAWLAPQQTPLLARQRVNGATGAALESLDRIPDLLEVPPTR